MKRYGLTIKMDMSNAAFADGNAGREAARILRELADRLESYSEAMNIKEAHSGSLYDLNGNRAGTWGARAHRINCN